MLTSLPTPNGTGIEIYGDWHDLKSLHQTIHHICDERFQTGIHRELVLSLAYEVRHAFQGSRETRKFGFSGIERVKYQGFRITWPEILYYTATVRHAAGLRELTCRHQADLYALEDCIIESLIEFNAETGRQLASWLRIGLYLPDNYLDDFFCECVEKFTFDTGNGQVRFAALPKTLETISPFSKEYKKFLASRTSADGVVDASSIAIDLRPKPDIEW